MRCGKVLIIAVLFFRASLFAESDIFDEDFLSNEHPVKYALDQIFSSSRACGSKEALIDAGFEIKAGPHRGMIVAGHPEIPGYLIKTYTDDYHEVVKELPKWKLRIKGSLLYRSEIEDMPEFKCPRKWIYVLPETPRAARKDRRSRRKYVLVVEDMDIEDWQTNLHYWKSRFTEEILTDLYRVMINLSLHDVSPSNLVFCKDGRIAFVDTKFYNGQMRLWLFRQYLSQEMRQFWDELCTRECTQKMKSAFCDVLSVSKRPFLSLLYQVCLSKRSFSEGKISSKIPNSSFEYTP
jgi:hypothetical protein